MKKAMILTLIALMTLFSVIGITAAQESEINAIPEGTVVDIYNSLNSYSQALQHDRVRHAQDIPGDSKVLVVQYITDKYQELWYRVIDMNGAQYGDVWVLGSDLEEAMTQPDAEIGIDDVTSQPALGGSEAATAIPTLAPVMTATQAPTQVTGGDCIFVDPNNSLEGDGAASGRWTFNADVTFTAPQMIVTRKNSQGNNIFSEKSFHYGSYTSEDGGAHVWGYGQFCDLNKEAATMPSTP